VLKYIDCSVNVATMTFDFLQPRTAPPSYEEALSYRAAEMRALAAASRSHSEDRTAAAAAAQHAFRSSRTASAGSRSSRPPLGRSARALDAAEPPFNAYWEQAARELDFCTCRKCQVR